MHTPGLVFSVRRMDIVHNEVQQAIRPQAVALAVFGGLAALAMLVLVGQGLALMLSRIAGEISVLRAVGATRGQAAVAAGLQGAVTVIASVVLAVVGAYAVSPLAPVGSGARLRPGPRAVEADPLVLAGGGAVAGRRPARPAGRAGLAVGPPGRARARGPAVRDRLGRRGGRPAGPGGDRDPPCARTRIRAAAGRGPCRPGRVHRGGDRGGDGRRVRREPGRAGRLIRPGTAGTGIC